MIFFSGSSYSKNAIEIADELGIALFTYDIRGSMSWVNSTARAVELRAEAPDAATPSREVVASKVLEVVVGLINVVWRAAAGWLRPRLVIWATRSRAGVNVAVGARRDRHQNQVEEAPKIPVAFGCTRTVGIALCWKRDSHGLRPNAFARQHPRSDPSERGRTGRYHSGLHRPRRDDSRVCGCNTMERSEFPRSLRSPLHFDLAQQCDVMLEVVPDSARPGVCKAWTQTTASQARDCPELASHLTCEDFNP